MQPYTYLRYRQPQNKQPKRKTPKVNTGHHLFIVAIVIFLGLIWVFAFTNVRAHAAIPEIRSGISGFCLDDFSDSQASNAKVDAWGCNDTLAQSWTVSATSIKHDSTTCLSVLNDGTVSGNRVVINRCDNAPGQVWLRDNGGYFNPNSRLCLNIPNDQSGVSLIISSCGLLSKLSEQWKPITANGSNYNNSCNSGTEGERVACYAEKEWTTWQAGRPSHATLLNNYTDGNGYEEWCADFVSYVYQEAGYPFTQGERNGWDEYNANNIQYMGFTEHNAANYIPQPGDVAYFNYSGGHVEIVVSGGAHPTFIYGDSATIDPSTGNGDMESNAITNDGAAGQVIYYLSPN